MDKSLVLEDEFMEVTPPPKVKRAKAKGPAKPRKKPAKKAKAPANRGKRAPLSPRSREVLGVLVAALALILTLSLISYSPKDPTFSGEAKQALNLIGPVGAYLADGLFILLGYGAYLMASAMVVLAFLLFLGRQIHFRPSEVVAYLVVVFGGSVLFHFQIDRGIVPDHSAGGFIGEWVGEIMRAFFSSTGTHVITIAVMLLAMMMAFDISLSELFKGLFRLVYLTLRTVGVAVLWTGGLLSQWRARVAESFEARLCVEGAADYGEEPWEGDEEPEIISHRLLPEASYQVEEGDVVAEVVLPPSADEPRGKKGKKAKDEDSQEPKIVERVNIRQEEGGFHVNLRPRVPGNYVLPNIDLLDKPAEEGLTFDSASLKMKARRLEEALADYGVVGRVVEIHPGPVVTMFEFAPAPGIKLSKITNLSDDLAMALEAIRVRIVAPIPGKGVVGIEVPNELRETVCLREIIAHKSFVEEKSKLTLAMGKDIAGVPQVQDLTSMPHLLMAGTTGSGKSVAINALICSILFKSTPDDVRFLMVDPKRLELAMYEGIPQLLLPVITDPKQAAVALQWAVEEMERRYELLAMTGVRNVSSYNKKIEKLQLAGQGRDEEDGEDWSLLPTRLPYIVIVIDEFADLMMVASKEVEQSVMRLAQMARAAGIHLILATQRPSVDVITGVIKANFPARVSFKVSSRTDSRTILDSNGAENLLGQGDMLIMNAGAPLTRIHGAFVADEEVARVVAFLKSQGKPEYDENILKATEEGQEVQEEEVVDEMYQEAVDIVARTRQASISMIQRRLRIGYNRSARMVERMEREGLVGPADGSKPREVLIRPVEGP